jgi:hypothetical protein
MNIVHRYLLLNQTEISNLWNVTLDLTLNKTKLEWSTIPDNVKAILSTQLQSQTITNLTFQAWGWVSLISDAFANNTISSLMSQKTQSILPNITLALSQLKFETIINTTLLSRNKLNCLRELSEEVTNLMEFKQQKMKRGFDLFEIFRKKTKLPTAYDIYKNAVSRARQVLSSNLVPKLRFKLFNFDFLYFY